MTERLTLCNALAKPADSAISNHRDSKPKEPMKIDRDHIFIDLETTGLDPSTGDIIEVAAIRTDNVGNLIATYSDKITPKVPVTIEASRVNGYTEEKWAQAISIEAAMATMTASILTGRDAKFVVVAHFADFDKAYLKSVCARYHLPLPFNGSQWICTGQLAWPLYYSGVIKSRSLAALCKLFGTENIAPHTAMGDVSAAHEIYWKMMQRMVPATVAANAIDNSPYGGVFNDLTKIAARFF